MLSTTEYTLQCGHYDKNFNPINRRILLLLGSNFLNESPNPHFNFQQGLFSSWSFKFSLAVLLGVKTTTVYQCQVLW